MMIIGILAFLFLKLKSIFPYLFVFSEYTGLTISK
jgi:hypothetical protein